MECGQCKRLYRRWHEAIIAVRLKVNILSSTTKYHQEGWHVLRHLSRMIIMWLCASFIHSLLLSIRVILQLTSRGSSSGCTHSPCPGKEWAGSWGGKGLLSAPLSWEDFAFTLLFHARREDFSLYTNRHTPTNSTQLCECSRQQRLVALFF